jgi:hypothetical protein
VVLASEQGHAQAAQEVTGKEDEEASMIEAANGDLKILRPNFWSGEEAFNVVAPCCVLGCWQGY